MSTNELMEGRKVKQVVYPDDRMIGLDSKVTSMVVTYVPGQMGMVPWIRTAYADGQMVLINVEHLAMIEFD